MGAFSFLIEYTKYILGTALGLTLLRFAVALLFLSMRNEMMFIFLSGFMQVLFLLGQLVVFNIVLGGTETIGDEETGFQITISTSGEWLSLIAYGARYIRLHPWIILSAGTGFAALFLSLHFS